MLGGRGVGREVGVHPGEGVEHYEGPGCREGGQLADANAAARKGEWDLQGPLWSKKEGMFWEQPAIWSSRSDEQRVRG